MAKQIRYDHFLHGGDYNPEQWLDRPDILKKDIEYFKKAHINTVSMGMLTSRIRSPMLRFSTAFSIVAFTVFS